MSFLSKRRIDWRLVKDSRSVSQNIIENEKWKEVGLIFMKIFTTRRRCSVYIENVLLEVHRSLLLRSSTIASLIAAEREQLKNAPIRNVADPFHVTSRETNTNSWDYCGQFDDNSQRITETKRRRDGALRFHGQHNWIMRQSFDCIGNKTCH